MKKTIVLSVLGIFFLGLVAAAWAFQYSVDIEGEVLKTGKKLDVVLNLSDFTLNTTSGNLTNTRNLTLDNKKDDRNMLFFMITNKTLTELECPDFENDCSVDFRWANNSGIVNNSEFIMLKGLNVFKLEASCVEFSCGQNVSIKVVMNEV